jgi:anti-sigma-K factor RskA
MTMLTHDDIALAGEYVLGLLDPAETAAAQARGATDAAFAAEIEAWRERLQSMVAGADTVAPDHIWRSIDSALPAPKGQDRGTGALRLWQGLTALSAVAAATFAFLAFPPAPTPTPEAAPLVAALGSEIDKTAIAARYDADSGELLMTPVSLNTGNLYPEIWIVPADGKARSLGMMATDKATRVIVSPEMREFMTQGGVLAITPEPAGGAPGGKATGPIIASGKITTI